MLFGSKQLKPTMMKVYWIGIVLNLYLNFFILLYELFWLFLTVKEKKEVQNDKATGTSSGEQETVAKVTRPQGRWAS